MGREATGAATRPQIDRTYGELDTPCLVIDLNVVEANVAEMAQVARRNGVRLRPHTKTHKAPTLARLQLEAGATGITCAKLGEAEIMADAGCDDILVAYPIWGAPKLRRLQALRERARVRVSLDSIEIAEGLGRLGVATGQLVDVFVEVDTGLGRLGRPPGPATIDLARRIDAVPGVQVVGLLTHAGHAYRASSAEDLAERARREGADLVSTADLWARRGLGYLEVSVGSTPTARVAAGVPGVTEIRPGTYIFNDGAMVRLGVATEADVAAFVISTVISRPRSDRVVVDAGSKCLTSDGVGVPDWIRAVGHPDLHFQFLSEEHGVAHLSVENPGSDIAIGDRLALIPSHVCPVVNLFDQAWTVRGDRVVGSMEIAARGRAS